MKKHYRSFNINSILNVFFLMLLLAGFNYGETVGDFDGDGKSDLLVRRRDVQDSRLYWYVLKSGNNGFSATQWGINPATADPPQEDIPVLGDFDGDNKTDIGVFRRVYITGNAPNYFYILRSSDNAMIAVQWGLNNDTQISQDYDGDGKADIAVTRVAPGGTTWYILQSRDGYKSVNIPTPGYPIRGDYDGDGKADCALIQSSEFQPKYFWVRKSSTGQIEATQFGNNFIDYAVPGDYDGDGKTDLAVWRGKGETPNGFWIWRRSSDGIWASVRFGTGSSFGDYAVPGDYDGDGKTDPAFWRESINGTSQAGFYILSSRFQGYYFTPWGRAGDGVPLFRIQAE